MSERPFHTYPRVAMLWSIVLGSFTSCILTVMGFTRVSKWWLLVFCLSSLLLWAAYISEKVTRFTEDTDIKKYE